VAVRARRSRSRLTETQAGLREFNMRAPNIGGFVTVNSTAIMEFDLFLKHS
jgi:hypothetical protein